MTPLSIVHAQPTPTDLPHPTWKAPRSLYRPGWRSLWFDGCLDDRENAALCHYCDINHSSTWLATTISVSQDDTPCHLTPPLRLTPQSFLVRSRREWKEKQEENERNPTGEHTTLTFSTREVLNLGDMGHV